MQKDINRVVFTGRLTKDPELRATPSGTPVCTLRVAIQRPPGREGADRGAAFYDLEVWNGLAETCARYLAKGRRVAVEARLEHDEWKTDGATRERNYLVGEEVKFLDAPPETGKQPAETPQADPEPAVA